MRLRVSDPALVPELLEFLHSRLDVVAEQITANEVSLSLLSSYASDAMRMELYLRVRAWEAAQRANERRGGVRRLGPDANDALAPVVRSARVGVRRCRVLAEARQEPRCRAGLSDEVSPFRRDGSGRDFVALPASDKVSTFHDE